VSQSAVAAAPAFAGRANSIGDFRTESNSDDVEVVPTGVVKNSQKLYRFFTDFFTGRGRGRLDLVGFGWIWLD
jgi:hypothetical protein